MFTETGRTMDEQREFQQRDRKYTIVSNYKAEEYN